MNVAQLLKVKKERLPAKSFPPEVFLDVDANQVSVVDDKRVSADDD